MKFKRLNDDKLQIILSFDDLQHRNIKKWDFVPHNPHAQQLFQEILDRAASECGFFVTRDTQLLIEAYPISNESFLLTITKVSGGHRALFDLEDELLEDEFMDRPSPFDDVLIEGAETVYKFANLEDVIVCAHFISNAYEGASWLYKTDDGAYYLVFDDISSLAQPYFGFLLEYGDDVKYAQAYLQEHGQLVMADRAIEILSGI